MQNGKKSFLKLKNNLTKGPFLIDDCGWTRVF